MTAAYRLPGVAREPVSAAGPGTAANRFQSDNIRSAFAAIFTDPIRAFPADAEAVGKRPRRTNVQRGYDTIAV